MLGSSREVVGSLLARKQLGLYRMALLMKCKGPECSAA